MLETLVNLFDEAVAKYSKRVAVKSEITGESWTYEQTRVNAYRVSGSLLEHKIGKGDYVFLISDNTPDFVFANYGILYTGATAVPVDEKLNPEDLYGKYFEHVKPAEGRKKVILVDEKHADKIRQYAKDVGIMDAEIIILEDALEGTPNRPKVKINEDDTAVMMYSSGTTSDSERSFKLPELTQKNVASNIVDTKRLPRLTEDEDKQGQGVYLAGIGKQWHSFEYMMLQALLYGGCMLHYTNRATFERVMKPRMKEVAARTAREKRTVLKMGTRKEEEPKLGIEPDYMLMIPLVADGLMNQIKSNVAKQAPITRKDMERKYAKLPFVKWAMNKFTFDYCLNNSMEYHYQWTNNGRFGLKRFLIDQIGERLYYQKIRAGLKAKLGNDKPYFIGGSAPLAVETGKFFGAIRMLIYQGYGQTETSPVICVNLPDAYCYGSSGPVIKRDKVLIVDAEELENGRIKEVEKGKEGVILVNGPNVFKGYHNDERKTQEVFINYMGARWLNTGDIGSITSHRWARHLFKRREYLNVLGRIGDLICLKTGEKKLATPIEAYYKAKKTDCIMVGNNQEEFGLLVIAEDSVIDEVQEADLIRQYCERFADSSKRFGVKFSSRNVRFIRKSEFDSHPEFVTNTMKRRRRIIEKHYDALIREACN